MSFINVICRRIVMLNISELAYEVENLQVWWESQCYKVEEHLVCLCQSEQQFDVENNEMERK